jgi:hypothetical protein
VESDTEVRVRFQNHKTQQEEAPRAPVFAVDWMMVTQTYEPHTTTVSGSIADSGHWTITPDAGNSQQATAKCTGDKDGFFAAYAEALIGYTGTNGNDTADSSKIKVDVQACPPIDLIAKDANEGSRHASASDGKTLFLVYKDKKLSVENGVVKIEDDQAPASRKVTASLEAKKAQAKQWAAGEPTWRSDCVQGADGSETAQWALDTVTHSPSDSPAVKASGVQKSVSISAVSNNAADVSVSIKEKLNSSFISAANGCLSKLGLPSVTVTGEGKVAIGKETVGKYSSPETGSKYDANGSFTLGLDATDTVTVPTNVPGVYLTAQAGFKGDVTLTGASFAYDESKQSPWTFGGGKIGGKIAGSASAGVKLDAVIVSATGTVGLDASVSLDGSLVKNGSTISYDGTCKTNPLTLVGTVKVMYFGADEFTDKVVNYPLIEGSQIPVAFEVFSLGN